MVTANARLGIDVVSGRVREVSDGEMAALRRLRSNVSEQTLPDRIGDDA